ncbi:MAG: DUF11 domain-containing protein [Cryobacterium sp.]
MRVIRLLLPVLVLLSAAACATSTAPPSGASPPEGWEYDPTAPSPPDSGPIEAVVVDLSLLPPGESARTGTLRAVGRRPELPISLEEADRLRAAALDAEAHPEVVQVASVGSRAPIPVRGFESMDFPSAGAAFVPPDAELAVGPGHVVAVTNIAFEFYNHFGASLSGSPIPFSTLFGTTTGCTNMFDPNVVYDEQLDRFVLGVDANGTGYCIAISQGPNPLGPWNVYSFATVAAGSGEFFDYPHAGVGALAIFVGANMYDASMNFLRGDVWAVDKQAMAAGMPLPFPVKKSTGAESTPQPMNAHGWAQGTWPSTGPHWVVTDGPYDGNQFGVWAWTDPFGANSFTHLGLVDLQAATGFGASYPVDAPQLGSLIPIQDNDWRVLDAEYRNGHVWMTHSMSMNPGLGVVDAVRWAELDPTLPAVVQAGIVVSQDAHRLFPDLAVNHCNDMTLGYTLTSSTLIPAVWVTGRLGSDPPGTIQAEAPVRPGSVVYSTWETGPYRWGDYTGATSGPDGDTTWYLGEYSKLINPAPLANWGTYVGVFSTACPTQGDLQLTKTDGASQAIPGTAVTYTLVVTNLGPADISGANLVDMLPAALTGVSWTCTPQVGPPASTCSAPSGAGSVNLTLDLQAGATVTVGVGGTLSPSATGVLSNTATVTAPGTMDPNPANDAATDVDALTPVADLGVTVTDGRTYVLPGTTTTYTVTVSNAGPSDAPAAVVTDAAPADLTITSWTCAAAGGAACGAPSGGGPLADGPSLPAGGSVVYTVLGSVSASAAGVLRYTVSSSPGPGVVDPAPGNDSGWDDNAVGIDIFSDDFESGDLTAWSSSVP